MKIYRFSFPKGFGFAINGLIKAISSERNLKVHLVAMVCVLLLGLYVHLSAIEWVIVTGCFGWVIAAELMNTAIEKLVDLVSPEFDPRAGLVKDIAAGAVLISATTAAVIGCIIFIPKLFSL